MKDEYSRSAVVVDAVDLPTDEDSDPAVAPLTPVGQQVGDQQSQTCKTQVGSGMAGNQDGTFLLFFWFG